MTAGFVQGENFSCFWYAIGQAPSFHIMMKEFERYGVKALPFVDDVPFLMKTKEKVKIDDHQSLLEFDWANRGDECSLGKAVMHRWAQLSNEQMGVEVKLQGENKM